MQLRTSRTAALGVAALTLVTAACSSSSKSSSSSSSAGTTATTAAAASGPTVASQMTLGGPGECQTNNYCIPGLKRVYGIDFKALKNLGDPGAAQGFEALNNGQIDILEVLSTDPQVPNNNLVVLNDDKHLQNADAVVPVIRTAKATAGVTAVTNKVSAALTTAGLTALDGQVSGSAKQDPQAAADAWLKTQGLDTPSTSASGTSLKVSAFNFPESQILAYLYGDAIKDAGATVTIDASVGSTRQVLEPDLQDGKTDMLLEYAASALEYVDKDAGLANGDINNNVSHLSALLQPKGVTVLTASSAIDTNAFAVTKATAQKYGLVTMSDLAKPFSG